ncbi:MAG TPA: outer membrane beta-barrel protein, partial [Fibrobacteria bacterium]|nr:outer membrane beta-barrel protein [Fibrobacteria bacterium]
MNNKIITTMFALTLITVSAPGVAHADGLILRGGLNLSDAATDPSIDADNQEYRRGLNLALLAEAGGGPARLVAGVGYENRGIGVSTSLADATLRLDYVTIPVMLSLGTVPEMGSGWMPRLFVNVGVEPAFLISSNGSLEDYDFDIEAERFDFGLRGEAGVEIPVSETAGIVLGA